MIAQRVGIGALLAACTLLVAAQPTVAAARGMQVESYENATDHASVVLIASAPPGEPFMRVDQHVVRIWFPAVHDVERFDHAVTTEAIRVVRLRSGAESTAVLRIELERGRSVRRQDVDVVRDGTRVTVRVRFDSRPAAAQATAGTAAQSVTEVPPRAPSALAERAPAPIPPATSASAAAATNGAKPPPAASGGGLKGKARSRPKAPEPELLSGHAGAMSLVGTLALLALVLGALYGGIRFSQARGGAARKALPIRVLATTRLGQRHELVLVRALGQDHLLSLHAGRIERLSSAPSPDDIAGADRGDDAAALRLGLGLFAPPALRKSVPAADAAGPASEAPPPFGEELLSFVRTQSRRAPGKRPIVPGSMDDVAEAAASISRLRSRAAS